MTHPPKTKIRFLLAADSWHGYSSEGVWGEAVDSGHILRVLNTPFYVKGLSLDDLIAAKLGPDGYEFERVVQHSGHSTYRLIPAESGPLAEELQNLQGLGCTWEEGPDGLLALDVPPESNIYDVYALLESGAEREVWDFEEGHVGHSIRPL